MTINIIPSISSGEGFSLSLKDIPFREYSERLPARPSRRASLMMAYPYPEYSSHNVNRLPSGLFFRTDQAEEFMKSPRIGSRDIRRSAVSHDELNYNDFIVPKDHSTKNDKCLYLPLLEVSVEVEVVATIAWTRLKQTFTNQATHPTNEATYCFPLYDESIVTAFNCTIGSDKVLKGVVKTRSQAKAEFKEAVARQQVAALLEEHTPEVFETSIGNIPAQTSVKIEVCYITELKADVSGDGILVTIPTSVAPRYGVPPSLIPSKSLSNSLAVPRKKGLQIQVQVLLPATISKIESRTHPVSVEMGSHGHTTTRNIRDLSIGESPNFDPKKARATLSDRSASLGKDFILLVQSREGQPLASRALFEPHPKILNHSALMVSINLRDIYTPNVVSPKGPCEIIFLADRSGSMYDKIETLKTAMRFFLKSLPNNCFFNICSFGGTHTFMWRESRTYNQENVDAALSYVETHFAANMLGTELLSALRYVVQKSNLSVNTEIIVLTDGEVWDSNNVFEFIRETRSPGQLTQKTRFFCLGIGEAVSHHLVLGIGRHGGGLAEVVPVDSAGDWMRKVIGILGAALTPPNWNIEITLDDDASLTNQKCEAGVCIQAPYHIPEFHALSRGSVYFLLSRELTAKVVKVKATAIASGESVTTELPIERLKTRRACVHVLAAKAVLGDLESGRSWQHDTSSNDNNANMNAGVDELARTEGERIGIEWQISSKWTSFIVVDDDSSLEKPSRWYRAERSELAGLTRPRFGAANRGYPINVTNDAMAYCQASPGFRNLSRHGRVSQVAAMASSSVPNRETENANQRVMQQYYGPPISSSGFLPGSSTPSSQTGVYDSGVYGQSGQYASLHATGSSYAFEGSLPASSSVSRPGITQESSQTEPHTSGSSGYQQSLCVPEGYVEGGLLEPIPIKNYPDKPRNDHYESRKSDHDHSSYYDCDHSSYYGDQPRSDRYTPRRSDHDQSRRNYGDQSRRDDRYESRSYYSDQSRSDRYIPRSSDQDQSSRNDLQPRGRPIPPASPPTSPAQEPTLKLLLDSVTVTGAFKLSPGVRTAMTAQFTFDAEKLLRDWSTTLLIERPDFKDVDTVLDTAMSIVYIENVFASDKKLWALLIQKALAWLEKCFLGEKQWESLFTILRSGLKDKPKDANVDTREGFEMSVEMTENSCKFVQEEEAQKILLADGVLGQEVMKSQKRKRP